MSRKARGISHTGLYHIIFRGINRQNIFEEEKDYQEFTKVLKIVKEQLEFKIYTYCLMSNHGHIFIKEKSIGDISTIMQKTLTKYAGWYNKKYSRSGCLFGNRYKSQTIEVDNYILSLVRYIHQNPKKTGIVKELEKYKWSSYNYYLEKCEEDFVDTADILEMLSENKNVARNTFLEFHREAEKEVFEIGDSCKMSSEQIRRRIIKRLEGKELHVIGSMAKC
ncbi:transposase [Alkaliphilus sp. AH-315-G20]|nr:transposase [Alkaliphilus sp. AH-315-G20]